MHSNCLQPEMFNIPLHANSHQYFTGSQATRSLRGVHLHFDASRRHCGIFHTAIHENVHPTLLQGTLQIVADFVVFHRQNVGQHFDECDLAAKGVIKIGKLHPNGPGSNNDQGWRHFRQYHGFRTTEHLRPIKRQARQGPRACPRGQDNMRRPQRCRHTALGILHVTVPAPARRPVPCTT